MSKRTKAASAKRSKSVTASAKRSRLVTVASAKRAKPMAASAKRRRPISLISVSPKRMEQLSSRDPEQVKLYYCETMREAEQMLEEAEAQLKLVMK